jgi:hypothetical protein
MENIIVSIDSEFRNKELYPNASNFVYDFKEFLVNIRTISLSSIEFPNTFYTFTEKRDNISFKIKDISNNIFKIELIEGSYTSDFLLNYVQDAFNKLISTNLTTQKFFISFNEISSKVTISSDLNFELYLGNTTKYTCLGRHMGYLNDEYSGSNTYTSENILNVIGEQYVYLMINNWGGVQVYDIKDNNSYIKCVFAKILLTQQKTYIIFDGQSNLITKEYTFRGLEKIKAVKISIVDKYGCPIDMNQDFSLTLEFKKIYDYKLLK